MRPTLVTNPADDDDFAALAASFVDDGVDGVTELETSTGACVSWVGITTSDGADGADVPIAVEAVTVNV